MISRDVYILKQSSGNTWSFSYKTNQGVVYKLFKENSWSEDNRLTKAAVREFSAVLLPDDSINVLYQDAEGKITLSKFNGQYWNEKVVFTNEKNDLFNVYFKTFASDNKIQIIFSIFNKVNNTGTLFHQVLDETNTLSEPKILDIIKYRYELPFILNSVDDNTEILMYQRFTESHEIGYKIYNKSFKKWSDFKVIDKSNYPYKDYSVKMSENIVHSVYIKKEENIDVLYYFNGNILNSIIKSIFQGKNIKSCLISLNNNEIWGLWIDESKIYSSFSMDDGKHFSTSPYKQAIDSSNIIKGKLISNVFDERKSSLGNEIYLMNEIIIQNLFFSDLYSYFKINKENSKYSSYIKYYLNEVCLLNSSSENETETKDRLISELKNQLEEQKNRNIQYERKLKDINEVHIKFMELKGQLNESINWLQQSIIERDEKIKLLEKANVERENEIQAFKEKFSENASLIQKNSIDKIALLKGDNVKKDNEIQHLKNKLSENEANILYLMGLVKSLNNKLKNNYSNKNIYSNRNNYNKSYSNISRNSNTYRNSNSYRNSNIYKRK